MSCKGFYYTSTGSSVSKSMPVGSTMNISIQNAQSIIRSVKFYKWAFSYQTIYDLGPYKYAGDAMYHFQANSYSYYFYHFYYDYVTISNSSNACKVFMTSQPQVCADLSYKVYELCPAGYTNVNFFCLDKCGDGSVKLNPQIAQCDDGNNKSGDGCSSTCMIEAGYECFINSTLNNISYCRLACGNGQLQASFNEICDDGNRGSGDGCSSRCTIETGFKCTTVPDVLSFCQSNCGDKIRDTN